jgi:hypothetical protein
MSWKCNVVKILPIWCRIEKYIRKVRAFTVRNVLTCIGLQRTNTENSKQIFPENELRVHSSNFHNHVSVSDSYTPTIDLPILLQEICGPTVGIYKSLTDT